MKITFLGATQNVTGSKHLLEVGEYKLILDCGLHQGRRKIANELNKNLPFDATKIDAVILSHAHLDHCGALPILVKNGFIGNIYCTQPTADIAKYILEDCAGLQEQDAMYGNKHLKLGEEKIVPIYDKADVAKTISHFRSVPYFNKSKEWTQLNSNIRFKFYDAGHVLGSAITVIEAEEDGIKKTLAFLGDLGREYLPILKSPEYIEEDVENFILECTYGNRVHRPIANLAGELARIVKEAVEKKSKIIVPAFSLERTQELIYMLHNLVNEKAIPSLPIYIDSPLASNITQVFSESQEYFDEQTWEDFGRINKSPFFSENIIYTKSTEESKALNNISGPLIIIAGSGMAEGGRILHHLKNNASNPDNFVLITGYQAENTLGRRIQEGVSPIKIFGDLYPMRAKVLTLDELSAHADQNDLLEYIGKVKSLNNLFLVHTELPQAQAFQILATEKFPTVSVSIPAMGQSFNL